jgi:diadenosine tetraphosphate (Ap4A) HIT family hydrolase
VVGTQDTHDGMRRQQLLEADPTIRGFNMGMNLGEIAGQMVLHCHFHLIPRRDGDGERMKGGVRGVMGDKTGQEPQCGHARSSVTTDETGRNPGRLG